MGRRAKSSTRSHPSHLVFAVTCSFSYEHESMISRAVHAFPPKGVPVGPSLLAPGKEIWTGRPRQEDEANPSTSPVVPTRRIV